VDALVGWPWSQGRTVVTGCWNQRRPAAYGKGAGQGPLRAGSFRARLSMERSRLAEADPRFGVPEPSGLGHAGVEHASRYFIEGEDAAENGKRRSDCRYVKGAIAWREWMAGFDAGTLDLSGFAESRET
jgi:hypothetical protein